MRSVRLRTCCILRAFASESLRPLSTALPWFACAWVVVLVLFRHHDIYSTLLASGCWLVFSIILTGGTAVLEPERRVLGRIKDVSWSVNTKPESPIWPDKSSWRWLISFIVFYHKLSGGCLRSVLLNITTQSQNVHLKKFEKKIKTRTIRNLLSISYWF